MIISCGEAVVDFVPLPDGSFRPHAGGSPLNVAVTAARFDVPTALLGLLSRDLFGDMLLRELERAGVDTSFILRAHEPSALAFVDTSSDEPRYAFFMRDCADSRLMARDLPVLLPRDAHILHFGSLGLVLQPTAKTLEILMRRERGQRVISLDPNVRPPLIADPATYRAHIEEWVRMVHLVKVSRADLEWLYPGKDPDDEAERWLASGPELVVLTRGAEGATAFIRGHRTTRTPPMVEIADTVGAGDAFMGALLADIHERGVTTGTDLADISDTDLESLLDAANAAAAEVCSHPGAIPRV